MAEEAFETIGRYRVTGRVTAALGKTAAGSCYRAVDPQTGRAVDVRLLSARFAASPAAVERFERDAESTARLDHPNIVRVLDHGREGDRPFVVTETFEGPRLAEVLRGRRLAVKEAISTWREVLKGLAHAHSHGVIHRDLHPGAVAVSPDLARVKLTDFGVGRVEALEGTTGTIATGEFSLGTLAYLAPEQAEGRPADVRSDIYSAGAIFHEMLTGRSPGGKFTLPSQLNTELPSDVDMLVLKCMARNPAERYGTVVHLLADLEKLEETLRLRVLSGIEGITRSLRGQPEGEAKPEKRSPVLLWVGIGVLVVVLAVVGLLILR